MSIILSLTLTLLTALFSIVHSQNATSFQYGFLLPSGTRIIHGTGSFVRDAYPLELNIPATLRILNPGHTVDPTTPSWSGSMGIVEFNTTVRMPRHVHLAAKKRGKGQRLVAERITVIGGVAVTEQAGKLFVVPPNSMVIAAAGVPHAWYAYMPRSPRNFPVYLEQSPPGIDFRALGLSGDEPLVSTGKFTAIFEYEDNTGFYATAQTDVVKKAEDYVQATDLQSIRIPEMSIEELKKRARWVWGREARRLDVV
ncbi:hypothetical protein BKA65DRAFT_482479 [Rhexocercosporidium sp. MPI-PUGE-AT-0058]|nr:hypothetical protein BKA65DRAFT_482479 [Rhexocercosporidium sp. MPI-PUGE-AT-0058]